MVGALLLAAGSGTRMQGEVEDKLLHPIGHSNAFMLSCDAFFQAPKIDSLVIVHKDESQLAKLKKYINIVLSNLCDIKDHDLHFVVGGAQRQDSVLAGIQAFPEYISHVLVHDCARPFIRSHTISQIVNEITKDRAVAIARPLRDTLRVCTEDHKQPLSPLKTRTIDRANHWLMETPQGAPIKWLRQGLEKAKREEFTITDDMAAIELLGHPVGMLEPDYPNPKITTPEDFSYAEFLLKS